MYTHMDIWSLLRSKPLCTLERIRMLMVLLLLAACPLLQVANNVIETCIVGAGPSGVQLGHFLHKRKRSYRIFERSQTAGSFFEKLPIHRKLISVNTVHTGSDDPEFNMRHDWNSLLENDDVDLVTKRTHEKWPHASVIHEYIQDFSKPQVEAGNIEFGCKIRKLSKSGTNNHGGRFVLLTQGKGGEAEVHCRDVVVATGLVIPRTIHTGEDLVIGYEKLGTNASRFSGQHVVVLGNGNAAFETVQWLENYAYVTLMHRASELDWKIPHREPGLINDEHWLKQAKVLEPAEGTRMAMMTHYVGDVRAARLPIFDAYNLKMRDRILRFDATDQVMVFRCRKTKVCAIPVEDGNIDAQTIHLSFDMKSMPALKRALLDYQDEHPNVQSGSIQLTEEKQPHDAVWSVNHPNHKHLLRDMSRRGIKPARFSKYSTAMLSIRLSVLMVDVDLLHFFEERVNHTFELPRQNRFTLEDSPSPIVADSIIRCFGWKMDTSWFDADLVPKTIKKGKYPVINDHYQDASGIYYAGSLAHSLDFRKSAGGFIHGFRYSARALFRLLEESRHQEPWPHRRFSLSNDAGMTEFFHHLLYRIGNAAGPYQMLAGTLLEGVVFAKQKLNSGDISDDGARYGSYNESCDGGGDGKYAGLVALYYPELPPTYFHTRFADYVRVSWQFQYGRTAHGPGQLYASNVGAESPLLAHESTFLHPHLRAYAPSAENYSNVNKKGNERGLFNAHWMVEDLSFRFSDHYNHVGPLRVFFDEVLKTAMETTVPEGV